MTAIDTAGTTSTAITRLVVDGAVQLGIPASTYTNLLGLAPQHLNDDLYRTPATSNIRLWELVALNAPWTEAAVLMTHRSQLGTLGLWDYLITAAPTVLEGIRDASTYLATMGDASTETLEVVEDGELITVRHVNLADTSYHAACAVRAYALGLYLRRMREAAHRPLTPVRVELATETPPQHGALIELYGTRAIDFGAPVSSMTFLAEDLRVPLPHTQPGLSNVLRRHAELSLAAAIPLHTWIDVFRTALSAAYNEGALTLPLVAQRLALSPRTLQRRLDDHGTSWSWEVDTVRRTRITQLLQNTELSVTSIASRTGYADARALRRAVQRWYGDTPGTVRRTLTTVESPTT
ncbi:AraC family transcriptional regulator [Nocardia tengchongensis]|uniref:AraC family transcriptional regulator n=1 Tax=Nocardia tengchongensis TaxID=2055889 RepID=UPI0036194F00